jgi:DNA-binding transcriptional LysR family regulator
VLCTIADAGSVRKAAAQLGMTQPSLTTQLRRIENAIGGLLFTRGQAGCQPTPLGRSVLSRARSIVADMSTLVTEAKEAAVSTGGARLRVGSIGSRAVPGWLRRLHARLPETDTTIHVDVSVSMLLHMVAMNQLDVAFVYEVEGFPLRLPPGVRQRVLVEREPQFIAMSATHVAAERPLVRLCDLAGDKWMVDPTADDECAAVRRAFTAVGRTPRLVHVRDNTTAAELVASAEAVCPCQPTSRPRAGTVIRPLEDDPLTVRLSVVSGPRIAEAGETDAVYADLQDAYLELAWANPAYREWLMRNDSGLLLAGG